MPILLQSMTLPEHGLRYTAITTISSVGVLGSDVISSQLSTLVPNLLTTVSRGLHSTPVGQFIPDGDTWLIPLACEGCKSSLAWITSKYRKIRQIATFQKQDFTFFESGAR